MLANTEYCQSNISPRHPLQARRDEPSTARTAPCENKASAKEKHKAQKDNEQWEKDAGNVCIPEVQEDDVKPLEVAPEKYAVVADVAEELPRPEATEETTQGNEVASELKEVADASVTDDEPQ